MRALRFANKVSVPRLPFQEGRQQVVSSWTNLSLAEQEQLALGMRELFLLSLVGKMPSPLFRRGKAADCTQPHDPRQAISWKAQRPLLCDRSKQPLVCWRPKRTGPGMCRITLHLHRRKCHLVTVAVALARSISEFCFL